MSFSTIRFHPGPRVASIVLNRPPLNIINLEMLSELNAAWSEVEDLKAQVADRLAKSPDPKLKTAGDEFVKSLSAVEQDIYQVKNQAGQDPLNFPIKTNNRLASLLSMVGHGDGRPIGNALPIFNDLKAELKAELDRLQEALLGQMVVFNNEARRLGLEAVVKK